MRFQPFINFYSVYLLAFGRGVGMTRVCSIVVAFPFLDLVCGLCNQRINGAVFGRRICQCRLCTRDNVPRSFFFLFVTKICVESSIHLFLPVVQFFVPLPFVRFLSSFLDCGVAQIFLSTQLSIPLVCWLQI